MNLKNFFNEVYNSFFGTNNPNWKSYTIYDLFEFWKIWHRRFTVSVLYIYGVRFSDQEIYFYLNFVNHVNKLNWFNWEFSRKYPRLFALIFRSGIPIKIIYIYKNLIHNLLNKFNVILNIITFNFKWILFSLVISIVYFIISLYYIQIDIAKQIALWYISGVIIYLLMSTFNSFLIKYKYGKYTSAIQRFWKRTGIVFWLVEGFLFLLFFYYFLNSSQEPLYMFDYSSLNQELLVQLKITFKNLLLLSLAIYLSFILLINLNYLNYYQNLSILFTILLIVFYSLYIETYQFIYIISLYSDKFWLFEDMSQSWVLEIEQNNIRVKQQYFLYCLIAKYWHFFFIFVSWFFFFIKSVEIKKINYTMLGYNTQNLLILYILNILCLIQWIKYACKKFLEITYYWFHIQFDDKLLNTFYIELYNTIISLMNFKIINIDIEKLIILSTKLLYSDNLNLWKFI